MERVIILVSAMLCLSLAVPGTFSQQPTNPPKQNFQAAKSPVSDVRRNPERKGKTGECAERSVARRRRVGRVSARGDEEHPRSTG